ncbi:RnR alpha subunit [Shewanella sp. phage 1/4]|uniref:ribonucleotide reductase large subunit n=1 Tax=Shewanella phage 1/4 TaxID=1458859 RepID=UPI0004F6D10E|nr:ribonucleotide reductase large subunit [Shewanella sp. phage 1/4]AHK11143.1 RnR alpha subunit [Shewanella sp. phage 1/4]
MSITTVIKSDGTPVPFDAEKFNKKMRWAAARKVNWSDISFKALKLLSNNCTTRDIDKAIIDACVEEFDEKHFMLAGRVLAGIIYKEAFGGFKKIPTLKHHHDTMVALGYWESLGYSEEEFNKLEEVIDHSKDLKSSYPEIKQINDKYIIRNRVKDIALESPQFMYMGMAMANMKGMPKHRRLDDVIKYYTYLSDKKICAPTPFMTNLRTPSRSYASCATFTTFDTVDSLSAGDHIAYMLTCASAGIGSHLKTRSKGDGVRGGTTIHQGKRPYYKMTESAVAANLQNSRGGSATMHVNCLDPEIMDILTWKSKKTAAKVRVDGIHYSFGSNKLFAQKVYNDEQWMLVSYQNAPELYEAMYLADQSVFDTLYHEYEKSIKPKTYISARKVIMEALIQGQESGQIYLHRTDELNRHTPHLNKIYSSNL